MIRQASNPTSAQTVYPCLDEVANWETSNSQQFQAIAHEMTGLVQRKPLWRSYRFHVWQLIRIVAFLGLGLSMGIPAGATKPPLPEHQMKIAFLYNFLNFVQWPENVTPTKNSPLRVLIVGNQVFQVLVGPLEQQRIRGNPIEVTLLERVDQIKDLPSYHLIYVAHSGKNGVSRLLQGISGQPVLTIGDTRNFAEEGGMIGFLKKRGKIKFVVNRAALTHGKLQMRSKALRLAEEVIE